MPELLGGPKLREGPESSIYLKYQILLKGKYYN